MAKASDNVFPKVLWSEETAPATPAAGTAVVYVDTADGKLKKKDDAGTVVDLEATGGAGSGVTVVSAAGDKLGNESTTSTTFVDFPAMSVTIAAAAGDVLEVGFNATILHSAGNVNCFFVADVSGTGNITPVVLPKPSSSTQALVAPLAAVHTVQAGDISGGNVTVKIQWKTASGTLSAYNGTVDCAPVLIVKNYGQ